MTEVILLKHMPRLIQIPLLLLILYCRTTSGSEHIVPIDHILKETQPPAGIVFEIVSDEDDLLVHLLPDIRIAVTKLREKFPKLPIAIVSHGKEQFALTSKNKNVEERPHDLVKGLVQDDIEVHVCGTHASWYGVTPEDFPEYIDVVAAGPTQIDDYEELGYELIVLTD